MRKPCATEPNRNEKGGVPVLEETVARTSPVSADRRALAKGCGGSDAFERVRYAGAPR